MAKDRISLLLTPELKAVLQQLADTDRRSLNSYITLLLEEHVKSTSKEK
jgi:hypothetical protein